MQATDFPKATPSGKRVMSFLQVRRQGKKSVFEDEQTSATRDKPIRSQFSLRTGAAKGLVQRSQWNRNAVEKPRNESAAG
jgi:hypothetical protein